MMFTARQAYLIMYRALDWICWENNDSDDVLMHLVSNFDPSVFVDSNSADPAAWEDWCKVLGALKLDGDLSSQDVLGATIAFVDFHQSEFGFPLSHVVDRLKRYSVNSDVWRFFVDRVTDCKSTRGRLINYGGYIIQGETVPDNATITINFEDGSCKPADCIERGINSNGSFGIKIPLNQGKKVKSITFSDKKGKEITVFLDDENVDMNFHGFYLGKACFK